MTEKEKTIIIEPNNSEYMKRLDEQLAKQKETEALEEAEEIDIEAEEETNRKLIESINKTKELKTSLIEPEKEPDPKNDPAFKLILKTAMEHSSIPKAIGQELNKNAKVTNLGYED